MSLHVAPISTRNQFGELLNDMGLTGEGVEVGTHLGLFARILLNKWRGRLHCVDPWEDAPPEFAGQVAMLAGPNGGDRARDYKDAYRRLRPYLATGRCAVHKTTSAAAAPTFPYESLDFVYLDGDHRAEAVYHDLELWWPRVRPGGVLAGHDVVCPGEVGGGWGSTVQSALFEFFREDSGPLFKLCHPVRLVVEEGGLPWSFYVVKPG